MVAFFLVELGVVEADRPITAATVIIPPIHLEIFTLLISVTLLSARRMSELAVAAGS